MTDFAPMLAGMAKTSPPWPADAVARTKLADLIPYARNARTHSDAQIAQLVASIREWGWTMPILIDEDGQIIAGHGRVLAAEAIGLDDVPTMTARGWSEAKRRAYMLADNKLALNAGWDDEILSAEFTDLNLADFDLGLTGFDPGELAEIFADRNAGLTDPDDVPEAPVDPVTALGDVWLLGGHRLRCGDSTSADDVAALLDGAEPHLMVTDPPYGVSYDPAWRDVVFPRGKKRAVGRVKHDDRADWREAWGLFPGDVAYVWHGAKKVNKVADSLVASGLEMRELIVWAKNQLVVGQGHYHAQHETCWYAVRKGKTGHWAGDRKQTTLWQIDKPRKSDTGHSTQKPVECMRRPIVNNSKPGDAVYDPFLGSGTTIIAAEMESRHVYAQEIDPAYVDVSVKRWQDFTGQDATLEATGETFNQRHKASETA